MKRAFFLAEITVAIVLATCLGSTAASAQGSLEAPHGGKTAGSGAPVTSLGGAQLIAPEDLVKILQAPKGEKPLVLNVGPHLLFVQAHIPGAEFIGPGSDSKSLQALRNRVKSLPRRKFIVLYCGCCPWSHCPNVLPAYRVLAELGFINAKVLYIADNLGVDWVYKGYPMAKGE